MKSILPVVTIGFMLACGSGDTSQTDTLTQRQKDSILANSKIPGARGVGSALRASDSVSARVQRSDSLAADTSDH
ncbi:MAG TPA: hypothetical protein VN803_04995 [Gemmatimonadales bacterium]|nr:hypothetical protein [Gemmatimonadales bacterium]